MGYQRRFQRWRLSDGNKWFTEFYAIQIARDSEKYLYKSETPMLVPLFHILKETVLFIMSGLVMAHSTDTNLVLSSTWNLYQESSLRPSLINDNEESKF